MCENVVPTSGLKRPSMVSTRITGRSREHHGPRREVFQSGRFGPAGCLKQHKCEKNTRKKMPHELEWYRTGKNLMAFWKRLRLTLEMIKFEHSVFALPFALTGALLAFRGSPSFRRTRIRLQTAVDRSRHGGRAISHDGIQSDSGRGYRRAESAKHAIRHIPRRNPERPIRLGLRNGFGFGVPAGRACAQSAMPEAGASGAGCNLFYSFTKRFTTFSHLILGLSLGIAPAAAWIAVRGSLDLRILWLAAAVTFWTTRVNIIYSCQDYEFDFTDRLYGPPRQFGMSGTLWIAQHFSRRNDRLPGAALALLWARDIRGWAGIGAIVLLLLFYEHRLVRADQYIHAWTPAFSSP